MNNQDGKLMIFLAPTVHLVTQQAEVLRINTDFKVEEYYGAKGVDVWTAEHWENERKKNDVMVMTPQILLDAMRKAFLSLDNVCLLVFDECHRTTGNHAYAKIMKEFYHRSANKPKIFGMTASPVTKKGNLSAENCNDQMASLESVLDSKIYTVEGANPFADPAAEEDDLYSYPEKVDIAQTFKLHVISLRFVLIECYKPLMGANSTSQKLGRKRCFCALSRVWMKRPITLLVQLLTWILFLLVWSPLIVTLKSKHLEK